MAKKETIDEKLFNKMRKKETVPLTAMDFIKDAYEIIFYIMKKIGNRILHLMK